MKRREETVARSRESTPVGPSEAATPRPLVSPSVLAVVALTLAGCGDASPDAVAARAGDWVLTEGRLADLLVLAQPFPLERPAAEGVARLWVGAAAVARHLAVGDSLADSASVRAGTWLERREAVLSLDRENRLGDRVAVDSAVAAATFREGDLRLVAHVLRRVGPESSASEVELQRRTAQRILAGLVAGGSWDAAVAESEDPETRGSSGLLGLVGRGELPSALDRIAFGLEAGQVSSVVRSPEGFHVVYRPRLEDVADLYARRLRQRRLLEADSASAVGLAAARHLRLSSTSPTALRRLAASPGERLDSRLELATWEGGALTEGTVARYVLLLPDPSRAEMAEAPEDALTSFVESVALRELRLGDAASRGLELDSASTMRLRARHRADVRRWNELLAHAGEPAVSRASLERYMDRVVARRAEPLALSPILEAHLLDGLDWGVMPPGIERAVTRARDMLRSAATETEEVREPPAG